MDIKLSKLTEEDRDFLGDYYSKMLGEDFAEALITDYKPKKEHSFNNMRKANKRSSSKMDGKFQKTSALDGKNRSKLKDYYKVLWGDEYANAEVEDYTPEGDQIQLKASADGLKKKQS